MRISGKRVYLDALDGDKDEPALDFEDALWAAHMHSRGVTGLYSYDKDVDRIDDIERIEP